MIEQKVAILGEIKRGFESVLYDEDRIENADDMHFVGNIPTGKCLHLTDMMFFCMQTLSRAVNRWP